MPTAPDATDGIVIARHIRPEKRPPPRARVLWDRLATLLSSTCSRIGTGRYPDSLWLNIADDYPDASVYLSRPVGPVRGPAIGAAGATLSARRQR